MGIPAPSSGSAVAAPAAIRRPSSGLPVGRAGSLPASATRPRQGSSVDTASAATPSPASDDGPLATLGDPNGVNGPHGWYLAGEAKVRAVWASRMGPGLAHAVEVEPLTIRARFEPDRP